MKRVISVAGVLCFSLLLSACDYGYTHVTDPDKYQRTVGSYTIEYFPEDISAYTVNDYSYTSYDSLDTCTEIFLDITVSEEQFDKLILLAEQYSSDSVSKTAYYNTDYTEIVYVNNYDDYNVGESKEKKVGKADIKKVIYNKDTNNIVYVYFKAYDTGVYPVAEVAYFNRFGIDEAGYALRTESNYER